MATSRPEFNAKTEGKEVVEAFADSIKGKTILITGVSPNGLGEETAKALATKGPDLLILTGRSLDKVDKVRQTIEEAHPDVPTRAVLLDVSSSESIAAAAADLVGSEGLKIDILINNAGVMLLPTRLLSKDGFEMHLATNHLGPFLFTELIKAKFTPGHARIVNVSSNGYLFQPFRFSDYNFDGKPLPESERPIKAAFERNGMEYSEAYTPVTGYGQSKTASILHGVELNRLYRKDGITAIALHPGAIDTELWRHLPVEGKNHFHSVLPMKTMTQGVSTTLVAALDPKLQGNPVAYMEDCQKSDAQPFATDPEAAEKLWSLSKKLTMPTT